MADPMKAGGESPGYPWVRKCVRSSFLWKYERRILLLWTGSMEGEKFVGRPADAASAACLECPHMHELSHSTWGARTIGALEAFTQDQVAPSLQ